MEVVPVGEVEVEEAVVVEVEVEVEVEEEAVEDRLARYRKAAAFK